MEKQAYGFKKPFIKRLLKLHPKASDSEIVNIARKEGVFISESYVYTVKTNKKNQWQEPIWLDKLKAARVFIKTMGSLPRAVAVLKVLRSIDGRSLNPNKGSSR